MKFFLIIFVILSVILISCTNLTEYGYYKGAKSDHFNGKTFFNLNEENKQHPSFFGYFKTKREYFKKNGKQQWPDNIEQPKQIIPLSFFDDKKIHATFVGHSTFLLQFEGLNILTDPVWANRASPFSFMGPERLIKPAINFDDLPHIDVVLISHSHYDHLDLDTVKALVKHSNPKIFTGLGMCYYLNHIEKINANCTEMDWGDKALFKNIEISFLSAKHWSKRALFGSNATLWGSFAIKSKIGNIYFAGDSAYSDHFKNIGKEFISFKLALLPIGAYKPAEFMSNAHISPAEAVMAHIDLNSKKSVAIHFGTFKLGMENYEDPEKDLDIARKEQKINKEFIIMKVGEQIII